MKKSSRFGVFLMSTLGEILVNQGLIKPDQLTKALDEQRRSGQRLTPILVKSGLVKEIQILKAMERHFQTPGIDLASFPVQQNVLDLVPRDFCEKHGLIPLQKVGEQALVVAFSDPSNMQVRDDLRFLTRKRIQAVVGTELSIYAALEKYHGANVKELVREVEESVQDDEMGIVTIEEKEENIDGEADGPVIRFVNATLSEAIRKRASDVHFEPYEKIFRVRYRIDGTMVEASSQPPASGPAISSRIKIMSKLDIAEKRRPQDGRIKIKYRGGKEMDFRVSVMPTLWGEKVVLRLLDKSNLQFDMTKLGFERDDLEIFKTAIHKPQGMVLITGPTGSGKTTTIYSALSELNQKDVNISTAEDPVEINMEGINQLQVNSDIGVDFAAAMRTFLRQDPDIIMVGEIRDLETAEIAAKAASTGHLVVSTLHTNDAPQTVVRLIEMGVAPYVVTSTISLIVAQRLVGKICDQCRTGVSVKPQVLLALGVDEREIDQYKIFHGKGCLNCNGTGVSGRIAIYELMQMSEKIKEAILSGVPANHLRAIACDEGMRTLRRSALLKLKRGETTIQEVLNSSVKDSI